MSTSYPWCRTIQLRYGLCILCVVVSLCCKNGKTFKVPLIVSGLTKKYEVIQFHDNRKKTS
jgi:hypothetical protein